MQSELGLPDFSPESQDQGALELIRRQDSDNARAAGVINDITNGNMLEAAEKLNGTWVSLPGGSAEKLSEEQFMKEFKENVGNELNGNSAIATDPGLLSL